LTDSYEVRTRLIFLLVAERPESALGHRDCTPGERLLSDPTAGAQPGRRGRRKLPLVAFPDID